jgi:hypothetical protein
VQEVIADCPPTRNQNFTCVGFDIIVLRGTDGNTYLLKNLPPPVEKWKHTNVTVTGILTEPSRSGLNFVYGDLYVLRIMQTNSTARNPTLESALTYA